MADAIVVRLGTEELVMLLHVLGAERIMGMVDEPYFHLDEDHRALAMAVTDRALRARGVVEWKGTDDRVMDQLMGALLHCCTDPARVLLVEDANQPELMRRSHYFQRDRTVVEYAILEPGVHGFVALGTGDDVRAVLHEQMVSTPNVAGGGSTGAITDAVWRSLFAAAGRSSAPLALWADLAPDLAGAFRAPQRLMHMAWQIGGPGSAAEPPGARELGVLRGEQGIWLITPTLGGDPAWICQPTDLATVHAAIDVLIEPLVRQLPVTAPVSR